MSIVTWLVLALGAGLASAVNVWASKGLVARARPAVVAGVVHLTGGILCLALVPAFGGGLGPVSANAAGLTLMMAVYVAGNLLYFAALAQAQLSELDLLLRSSALWTFLGGVVLLGERAAWGTVLGAGLILVSVALLSKGGRRAYLGLDFNRAQLLALAAALAFGAGNVIDKALSPAFPPMGYTALNLLLTGFGVLVLVRPGAAELRMPALWGKASWLVAATFALTQLLLILAFAAGGGAGQVILAAQIRMFVLVAVGVVLLRERDRLARKLLAGLVMLAGVYWLASGAG
jgi:drug/metabolite transporter (DMT)-like permease